MTAPPSFSFSVHPSLTNNQGTILPAPISDIPLQDWDDNFVMNIDDALAQHDGAEPNHPHVPQWYTNFEASSLGSVNVPGNGQSADDGGVPHDTACGTGAPAGSNDRRLLTAPPGVVVGHMPWPELNPDSEILDLAEDTYDYWLKLRTLRILKEYDVPQGMYIKPNSNVQKFNKVFPLPASLYNKIKLGVRVWPTKQYIIKKPYAKEPKAHMQICEQLLTAGIIEEVPRQEWAKCRFLSRMFIIPKGTNSIRPIFNYSALTPFLVSPKFVLPSIFQVARKMDWPRGLFYAKLDIKQAFFNINMHPKSKYVTTFQVEDRRFTFNYLPFGLSIAPYICQKFINAICVEIRKYVKYVWGHIDDILIADLDSRKIDNALKIIRGKLEQAGWPINYEKSVLNPVIKLEYLGAIWWSDGVDRTPKASQKLHLAIDALANADDEQLMKLRGYINYYINFSGKVHALLSAIIREQSWKHISLLHNIAKCNQIKFYHRAKIKVLAHVDATPTRAAAIVHRDKVLSLDFPARLPIIRAELLAALLAMYNATRFSKPGHTVVLSLHTDNKAVLWFLRRGSCRFLSIQELYRVLDLKVYLEKFIKLCSFYIPSENNPADYFSRHQ